MNNKEFKSKYYDIDAYYENVASQEGWRKEDFIFVLSVLESLPKEKLIEICKSPEIQLRFSGDNWEKIVDEEEIIGALISDYPPEDLILVAKKWGLDRPNKIS
jgi:hypothetical protein